LQSWSLTRRWTTEQSNACGVVGELPIDPSSIVLLCALAPGLYIAEP
jgi:hypothetical protein